MPFGPSPKRYSPGQARPGAKRLNAPLDLLHKLTSMRLGGYTSWTPGGVLGGPKELLFRVGRTGGDGIDGTTGSRMTGADVTDVTLLPDPTDPYAASLQTWTTTYIGFNLSSQPVAGNTLIISAWMWGLWVTIWEDCPADSG